MIKTLVTLLILGISLFSVNCKDKKDNLFLLFGAALLSQQSPPISPEQRDNNTSGSTFSIGGTITGLTASGLILQNNSADDLIVTSGATSFNFTTKVTGAYSVTVKTQPSGLTCTISNGSGTATANVSSVTIGCSTATYTIGGSISGLTASGLVLQNNSADDLTVASGATSFSFATKVTGAYLVTVKTQPTGRTCTTSNEGGTASADVNSISISCQVLSGVSYTALTLSDQVTTIAGSGVAASTDGTGTAAAFNFPVGIITDGTNLYIGEYFGHKIRKMVISTGVVTTLAGSGTSASVDGTGTGASFRNPVGMTSDGTNIYVAESSSNKIRKVVISTGVVTTLAGSFSAPNGVATDGSYLYVTENVGHRVKRIHLASGTITTLAGSGSAASTDGTGTSASFNFPAGMTSDGINLYVADYGGGKIRKVVIATGVVTTLAGSGTAASTDGTGAGASFHNPNSITMDGTNLYIVDENGHKIRKLVISTGVVTTVAGSGTAVSTDGTGAGASFNGPRLITSDGTYLYVTDGNGNKIRRIE